MAPKKSQSLLKYLRNQSDYLNARQALSNYAQTFKGIELQFNNTPASSKNFSEVSRAYKDAQTRIDALQKAFNDAEAAATARFNEQQAEKTKSKTTKEASNIEAQLNPLYVEKNERYIKQGLPVPASIQNQITELETKLRKVGGRPTPSTPEPAGPTGPEGGTGPTGGTGTTGPTQSALTEDRVTFAQRYIGNVEKTKELQQALKNANVYKGKVDGIFRADEINRALDAAETKISDYETYGITFPDRIAALKRLADDFRTGGGPGGEVPTTTISSRPDATIYINAAFKQAGLNREATPQEVDNLLKVLNDAESRFRTTKKGGVTRDLLGNRTQFLTNLISTGKYVDPNTGKNIKGVKPEIKKAAAVLGTLSKTAQTLKADTRSLTVQTLQSTANANGVVLSPEQLNQYALDVQNGKDVKVIQSQIRNLAGLGMPDSVKKLLAEGTDLDTIYSPYKQTMAAVLELNPTTISFTDPVLRSAIGPNGETPLYDFQRALRKDARWQYTNNAREDVFQSVNKVLQDFGFQG